MQDPLLDAVEAAARRRGDGIRRSAAGARRRRPAAPPQPPLQLRRRHPPRRAARRGAEVVPADVPRVLRAPPVRPRRRPAGHDPRRRPRRRRSVPTCCSPPSTCPASSSTSRSARTCGCRSRRAPRPRSPARPCWPTCRGSPITIGRAEDRKLLGRSQSPRCLAAYVYAAAGEGESTTDLAWDGQTMIYEDGVLLAETERFPDGPRRAVADVDLDLLRAERAAHGHVRRQPPPARRAHRRVPADRLPARPADGRPRPAPHRRPLPVRARRPGPPGPGLLRGLQHPGRRARAAAAGDRRPEGRHRRVGRPRLDPRPARRRPGDGPPRPAAQRHPRLHAARLRHRRAHEGQRDRAGRGARRDVRDDRHHRDGGADARTTSATRSPTASRCTTSRSRTCRPACAPTTCSGRQPARRHRHRHRRPVRARARLVHLRRRRPDDPLRRQRRRAQDADPAPHPLGRRRGLVRRRGRRRCSPTCSTPRSPRSWCRPARTRRSSAPRTARARTRCTTSRCSTCCATASGRRRSPSSPGTPGTTRTPAPGRPASPPTSARRTPWPRSAAGSEVFAQRFFGFAQFKRSAMPNGPKVAAGGSLSPRGDWRAPSDLSAAIWLDELRRHVPTH